MKNMESRSCTPILSFMQTLINSTNQFNSHTVEDLEFVI